MGLILIMTDSAKGDPEIYRTLSLKDEKVEVHAFKEARDLVKDCMVDIILLDCDVDVDAGLKLLKENKSVCPHIPASIPGCVVFTRYIGRGIYFMGIEFSEKINPANQPSLYEHIQKTLI